MYILLEEGMNILPTDETFIYTELSPSKKVWLKTHYIGKYHPNMMPTRRYVEINHTLTTKSHITTTITFPIA